MLSTCTRVGEIRPLLFSNENTHALGRGPVSSQHLGPLKDLERHSHVWKETVLKRDVLLKRNYQK